MPWSKLNVPYIDQHGIPCCNSFNHINDPAMVFLPHTTYVFTAMCITFNARQYSITVCFPPEINIICSLILPQIYRQYWIVVLLRTISACLELYLSCNIINHTQCGFVNVLPQEICISSCHVQIVYVIIPTRCENIPFLRYGPCGPTIHSRHY